jgi:hypothetical protein
VRKVLSSVSPLPHCYQAGGSQSPECSYPVQQLPAVWPRLGKLKAASQLLVLRRLSPTQGVPRERKYVFHDNILQQSVGGTGKTPSRKLSGLQTCEGVDAEIEVTEVTQDYNGKGVLFQPHHSRHVLRGGDPKQDRRTAAASDTSGSRSRHNGTQGPLRLHQNTISKKEVSQFGPQI